MLDSEDTSNYSACKSRSSNRAQFKWAFIRAFFVSAFFLSFFNHDWNQCVYRFKYHSNNFLSFSYTVTMLYNYTNRHALLSYLEYPIIIFQEYIIIALVLHYKKKSPIVFLSILLLYSSISLAFAYHVVDKFILTLLLVSFDSVLSLLLILIVIWKRFKIEMEINKFFWFFAAFYHTSERNKQNNAIGWDYKKSECRFC